MSLPTSECGSGLGKQLTGTLLHHRSISQPLCCKERKGLKYTFSDLSKYNSQVLSIDIATRFCDGPGKEAVLSSSFEIRTLPALKVTGAYQQPQNNTAPGAGVCPLLCHPAPQRLMSRPSQSNQLLRRDPQRYRRRASL